MSYAQRNHGLTRRERDVLALLVTGMKDREIALELGVSSRTVSNYVATVLLKLNVRTRTEAAVLAVSNGLSHNGNGQHGAASPSDSGMSVGRMRKGRR